MKYKITAFIFIAWVICITVQTAVNTSKINSVPVYTEDMKILVKHSEFLKDWKADKTTMLAACRYYGIKYPEIVTAQAILESGDFKSKIFREYNNPFGLYNSSTHSYYRFSHWTYAVLAYKTMIESKYKGGDYYKFLEELPYAKDKNYIKAVKAIEEIIKDEQRGDS